MLSQRASPLFSVVESYSFGGPEGPRGLELDARGKGGELTPFFPWVTSRRYLLDNCVVLLRHLVHDLCL